MSIRIPSAAPTHRDNLQAVAGFFGIPATGKTMQELTGISNSSLSRVAQGASDQPREWQHLAVLAEYVRELAFLMTQMSGRSSPVGNMATWLTTATLQTRSGRMYAKDVLADPDLARDALDALRLAAE